MARVQSSLKLNAIKGPRLPYPAQESEIRENEYAYLSADGIAIPDGEGILYWIDVIVTSDGGGARVYDNTGASGNTLAGAYAAKAVDGVLKSWDPPKKYEHGVYVDLTNAIVEVCYKPIARNLRCQIDVAYGPGTSNVVCRVTVTYAAATKNLVSRVTTLLEDSSDLVGRLTVAYAGASSDLVSQVTTLVESSLALVTRVSPMLASETDLVSRVIVMYAGTNRVLVCQVTVTS